MKEISMDENNTGKKIIDIPVVPDLEGTPSQPLAQYDLNKMDAILSDAFTTLTGLACKCEVKSVEKRKSESLIKMFVKTYPSVIDGIKVVIVPPRPSSGIHDK